MFTTISLLTPFAAWVKVSSMMYCAGNRRQSTTHVWWGLKQTGIGFAKYQTVLKCVQVTEGERNGCTTRSEMFCLNLGSNSLPHINKKDGKHYRKDDYTV